MQEGIQYIEAASSAIKERVSGEIDQRLCSLNLFEYKKAREMIGRGIRGIEVEPIPPWLEEKERAILVSNYPVSLGETIKAALKTACRLPGEKPRFKAIGREEVVEEAGFGLKIIGVEGIVYQAKKDESGEYKLKSRKAFEEIKNHLQEPGHVLWLSITGETKGNGLSIEDLRTGAVSFSLRTKTPIVPMAIVTKEKKERRRAVKVRFGKPISLPEPIGLDDFEIGDFPIDYSKLVMCRIAELLPPGQRGSFEDVEKELENIEAKIKFYTLKIAKETIREKLFSLPVVERGADVEENKMIKGEVGKIHYKMIKERVFPQSEIIICSLSTLGPKEERQEFVRQIIEILGEPFNTDQQFPDDPNFYTFWEAKKVEERLKTE